MLVERSLHPSWLSNAYLVGDEPGGAAVFVDSGAPLEPLVEEEWVGRYGQARAKLPEEAHAAGRTSCR